jgi:DNA-binding NarL/FixJ family response regulator
VGSGAILLVGLSPLTALGIAAALGDEVDPARIESIADPAAALERAREEGDVELAIVDPYVPSFRDGLRFCREVKELGQPLYILALSDFNTGHDLMFCLLAGVDSVVSSREPPDRMVSAVASTLRGRREWLLGGAKERGITAEGGEWEELTPREVEILWLVRDGRTNRQIASSLVISPNTVKNHVAAILRKVGARRRSEIFPDVAGSGSPAGGRYRGRDLCPPPLYGADHRR